MVASAAQLRPTSPSRHSFVQVRYAAPADLLPWADPYIASLFAEDEESQADIDTVVEDEKEPAWLRG